MEIILGFKDEEYKEFGASILKDENEILKIRTLLFN
jgi:alanine dehydrogenase